MFNELIRSVRGFLARANEPVAPSDFEIARRMSAAFWFIGIAIAIALLPLSPPVEAIGSAGWIVVAIGLLAAAWIGWMRLDPARALTLEGLYASSAFAVLLIAAVEWLAGGRDTPYHFLYWLPVLYAAAAHRPSRVFAFLVAVIAVATLPLAYEGWSEENALGIATQSVMFLMVGSAVWVMFVVLRAQRAEIRARKNAAEAMALEDELTGLGNRRAFVTAVTTEIARSERSGDPFSILIADLDRFKMLNDRLGHVRGDRLLRRVSRRLLTVCRDGDACFRWGGDEFAILLPSSSVVEAAGVGERLELAVGGIVLDDGINASITYGVAQWEPGIDLEGLTHAADADMMALKRTREPTEGFDSSPPRPAGTRALGGGEADPLDTRGG